MPTDLADILTTLDGAGTAAALAELPGIHPLRGKFTGLSAVRVNRQKRVIFRRDDGGDSRDIDLVDHH